MSYDSTREPPRPPLATLYVIAMAPDIHFTAPAMLDSNAGRNMRVLVVDDHPSMRMGLVALVNGQPGMEVVAEASDGEEAFEVYADIRPDIVLMDLRMPGMGGVEAIFGIRKLDPDANVIILSTYDWDEDIHLAIQSGVKSYLLKDTSVEEIVETMRRVYEGDAALPGQVARRLVERSRRQQLTEREREVLEFLIKGRSNKEIASSLFISEETVKSHLKTLYGKLQVRDRTEAAIAAIRHGIVHLD